MRIRLLVLVALVVVFGVVAVAPAAADTFTLAFTAAEDEEEAPAEDEEEPMVSEGGVTPAVEAPPAEEDEADQPWTFRYMVPTVLAIGVLGLIGAGVYYAFQIRGRYQVVE